MNYYIFQLLKKKINKYTREHKRIRSPFKIRRKLIKLSIIKYPISIFLNSNKIIIFLRKSKNLRYKKLRKSIII
jgi:hypothetical protein